MGWLIENIELFSDDDDAQLLSWLSISGSTAPFDPAPNFYYSLGPTIFTGNGVLDEDNDSILLLNEAIYSAALGGPSEPYDELVGKKGPFPMSYMV